MKTILFIFAAIVVTVWYLSAMKKIDREEEIALKTPGNAVFLRTAFGEFISIVLKDPNNYIIFERSDQIKFAKRDSSGKELIIENFRGWKGAMMSVVIWDNGSLLAQYEFREGTNPDEISDTVLPHF